MDLCLREDLDGFVVLVEAILRELISYFLNGGQTEHFVVANHAFKCMTFLILDIVTALLPIFPFANSLSSFSLLYPDTVLLASTVSLSLVGLSIWILFNAVLPL